MRKRRYASFLLAAVLLLAGCGGGERQTEGPVLWFCADGEHGPALAPQPYEGETTVEDIDLTVEAIAKIVERLRSMSPLYEDFVKQNQKKEV